MSIRLYKSYTPGTRNRALSDFSEITKSKPEIAKQLLEQAQAEVNARWEMYQYLANR